MDIVREDPPQKRGRGASEHHLQIAQALIDDIGNWYKVAEGEKSPELANRIKKGIGAYEPAGAFEATARSVDGTWSIWARYVWGAG